MGDVIRRRRSRWLLAERPDQRLAGQVRLLGEKLGQLDAEYID